MPSAGGGEGDEPPVLPPEPDIYREAREANASIELSPEAEAALSEEVQGPVEDPDPRGPFGVRQSQLLALEDSVDPQAGERETGTSLTGG